LYRIAGNSNATEFVGGTGSSSTARFYSFGAANGSGTPERALGMLTGTTYSKAAIGVIFTNNTGVTLTSFTISYTGEQWRAGYTSTGNIANVWSFQYAIGSYNDISSPTNAQFTGESNLNFTSPNLTGTSGGTTISGNSVSNQTRISYTINGITWNNGDKLVLRWDDATLNTNNNANAIDNFYFAAYPSSNTYTWTGSVSTDYTVAGNWSPNRSSVSTSDILQVNASSTTLITNIPTQTIAALHISGSNTVTLQGSASNILTVTNSALIYSKATLALSSNIQLNVSPSGRLYVGGTLNANSAVTLKSDASGTGSDGGSVGGTISGNITTEQYIPGGFRTYRFLGHPFSTTQPLSILTNSIDITGSGGNSNGFTNTSTNNPSAFSFTTTNADGGATTDAGWTAFTSATTSS